ncbi:MAG: choice-of-anchor D domain-containing protein [Gemmatimonadetes bacterium]|nr:choice-of-anchor D domain-containing protein [Gemmatimonadota bacterium]
MLGLDAWNGNQAQVDGFRRNGGITFPLLLNAGGAAPAQYENFVVVRPNGTALPVIGGLSSSSVTRVKDGVNELLAQIPPPAPTIAVPQTAVDFGTIDAGQTGQQTITITNTGTAPLEITGIESDVPGLTFDTTMFTLAPDSSATVTIAFPSSTAGTLSGNITISSNDPNSATQTLSVSIIVQSPSAPAISVPQTAVNFGTIDVGQTREQTITVANTGTGPLEITGIESDVSGLTFEPSMFTVEPNGSQTVTIRFPGSTAGTLSGNITISSNDPNSATQTLSVSIIVKVSSANPRADFNGDKQVNITDFLLFVEAFGSTNPKFDIDGDGAVGITDFLLFVESFGKTVDG